MHSKTHRYALSKPMQLGLCLLVLALSLASVLLGSRLLMAGLHQYRANSFLSDWERKRQGPQDAAWQTAEQAMHQAQKWYPAEHGAYAEQLGYMWQWRAYGASPGLASTELYQQQAIQAFRQASQLRPSWPYAWSGLAYAKLVAGEYDQEFRQAIQQAAHYGPSRIGINRRLAEIGLISWPELTSDLRTLTLQQASYTARYSRASRTQLFNLAAELDRVELLCDHLQDGITPCAPLSEPNTAPINPISAK